MPPEQQKEKPNKAGNNGRGLSKCYAHITRIEFAGIAPHTHAHIRSCCCNATKHVHRICFFFRLLDKFALYNTCLTACYPNTTETVRNGMVFSSVLLSFALVLGGVRSYPFGLHFVGIGGE